MDTSTSMFERWTLGVNCALLNCVLSSLGFTVQRKSHIEELKLPLHERRPPKARPLWMVGVIMYMTAALPDVLAYALIPQIICSTIGCVRLVMVTLFAHTILGETVRRQEIIGMMLCTMGTSCCLYFGPAPSYTSHLSPSEILSSWVLLYLLVGLSLLLVLIVVEHMPALRNAMPMWMREFILPFLTALAFCLEKIFNSEIGYVHSVQDLWSKPQWTLVLLGIAGLGVCDFYLNLRGVERMPVQVFVPIAFAFLTVLQYFQGLVVLNEFVNMDKSSIVLCTAGAVGALAGALVIQPPLLHDGRHLHTIEALPGPDVRSDKAETLKPLLESIT